MAETQKDLPEYITNRMKDLQTELGAKAQTLPDGSYPLKVREDMLAVYMAVFNETTLEEAQNQVNAIVQTARKK